MSLKHLKGKIALGEDSTRQFKVDGALFTSVIHRALPIKARGKAGREQGSMVEKALSGQDDLLHDPLNDFLKILRTEPAMGYSALASPNGVG